LDKNYYNKFNVYQKFRLISVEFLDLKINKPLHLYKEQKLNNNNFIN